AKIEAMWSNDLDSRSNTLLKEALFVEERGHNCRWSLTDEARHATPTPGPQTVSRPSRLRSRSRRSGICPDSVPWMASTDSATESAISESVSYSCDHLARPNELDAKRMDSAPSTSVTSNSNGSGIVVGCG